MGKSELRAARALLFVSCLVWIFSFAPDLYAQGNFFQGKSIRVVRGGQPGDLYDLQPGSSRNTWENIFPVNRRHGAEHAWSRFSDRGQLCLQRRQAGRAHAWLAQFGHLHGPTDRP